MVLFLVTFLSCLLKFSIAFVVYISFLIPSGYLKYVDNSVQLFFQELIHIGYFLLHFSSKTPKFVKAKSSVGALYTAFRSFINSFMSLCDTYFVEFLIWWIIHFCISALGYTASIASLNPGRLSVEKINTSSSPLSFSPFNTKSQYLLDSFSTKVPLLPH